MLISYWKVLLFLTILGLSSSFSSCSILQADYDWNQVHEVDEEERIERVERVEKVEEVEKAEEVVGKVEKESRLSKDERLRQDVLHYAKKYVGSRYRYGGTDPKSGFDCSGFTYYVMKEFDVNLSRTSRSQETNGKSIKLNAVQPGDLVFFRRSKRSNVFHVALVLSNSRKGLEVIHSTNRGVVIDNISENDYWKPKLSSARSVL